MGWNNLKRTYFSLIMAGQTMILTDKQKLTDMQSPFNSIYDSYNGYIQESGMQCLKQLKLVASCGHSIKDVFSVGGERCPEECFNPPTCSEH